MSLKTTIKQLLPNSWILKRQRMKAAIQLRKDVHTDCRRFAKAYAAPACVSQMQFAFVNSDDYAGTDYFEKMLSYADETIAIVYAEANRTNADGSVVPFLSKGIVRDVVANNACDFSSQYSHEVRLSMFIQDF